MHETGYKIDFDNAKVIVITKRITERNPVKKVIKREKSKTMNGEEGT